MHGVRGLAAQILTSDILYKNGQSHTTATVFEKKKLLNL